MTPLPRDVDAMVAGRVMGWTRNPAHPMGLWQNADGITQAVIDDFRPSTDCSAAWLVVERVLSLRWDRDDPRHRGGMTDCALRYNPYEHEWVCVFNWSDNKPVEGAGRTMPEAVCRAALSALAAGEERT